jgi:glucosylceramidase
MLFCAFPATAQVQATGTADFTTNLQQIDGFGFANPFGRSGYLQNSPLIRDAVVDKMFNTVTGAGASILRLGIITDSNIEPNSPGDPNATPTYVWDGNDSGQVWLAQYAQKYGTRRFYQDSWGAPSFMKTNGDTDNGGQICGMPGATACATGDWRQAYANFVVQYAQFYHQAGIPVTDINFVNEPNENVTYASLTLSNAQVVDFEKNYFGPAVQASGLTSLKIVCCDHSNWTGAKQYDTAVNSDPVAAAFVTTYSGHEYGATATSALVTGSTKHSWMSEWASANATAFNDSWDMRENNSTANNGMNLAMDISRALTQGNVSAYLYWYGDSTGATGGFFSLSATSNATSFMLTKRLWALADFARFVRPGAYRVPATTSNSQTVITAFRNTNGNKVINLLNQNTSAVNLLLTLDASTASWLPTTYVTDENNAIAPVSGIAGVTGNTLSVTLSPRSMTSVLLAPPKVSGSVQLLTSATLQKFGDGSYQATVKVSNLGTGTASQVELDSSSLGSAAGDTLPTAPLPYQLGDIAPGSFAIFVVNFPASAGNSGAAAAERYMGSYDGGSFSGSMRAVLPGI